MTILTNKVDKLFANWDKPDSPGCAIAIIQDGQVLYSRGYGMANLEHDIPISTTSVFDIASTSKQFTAMSIALLARQGKLSLDDKIQIYLPKIPHYQQPITIRHLLHHTSGMRDYLTLMDLTGCCNENHYPDEEIISLIARQKELNFQPGEECLYSNTGYLLLGEIVKHVSGKSLRVFADEHIFMPLGMKNTHFYDDFTEIIKHRAVGYSPKDAGGFQINMSLLDVVGDGGLYTTIADLCLWDANFDRNIIGGYGQDLIEEMTTPGKLNSGEVLDYGFGLIIKVERGLKTIGHNGGWAGYLSEVIRFPDRRFSVICLSNLSNINLGKLARQISDIYLAGSSTEPTNYLIDREIKFIELSTAELETKTGLYFNVKSGRSWELTMQAEKLMVDAGGFDFQIMPIEQNYYHSVGFSYDINVKFEQQDLQSPVMMSFWVEGGKPTILEKLSTYTSTLDRLADCAGEYFCAELDIKYQFSIEDGSLTMSRKNCPPDRLKPFSHNSFKGMYNSFEFTCNDQNQVIGFNLNGAGSGRLRSIYFIKQ